jgi:hypothetical protein
MTTDKTQANLTVEECEHGDDSAACQLKHRVPEQREQQGRARARAIAAIHAYANWLAAHPEVPLPTDLTGSQHIHGDDDERRAKVRGYAARVGCELVEYQGHLYAKQVLATMECNGIDIKHQVQTHPRRRTAR